MKFNATIIDDYKHENKQSIIQKSCAIYYDNYRQETQESLLPIFTRIDGIHGAETTEINKQYLFFAYVKWSSIKISIF